MRDNLPNMLRSAAKEWREENKVVATGATRYDFALEEAADAIEELQATICNWCAVCPEDKRDLSTCEIYESCRAKQPKEE